MSDLEEDRALLDRTSTAEKVADILRVRIIQGRFPPGTQLGEKLIEGALGVSRNTLREAFRLLTHEGLLVHELNRGVFVRVPSVDDVADIFHVRRLVECHAVHRLGTDADLTAEVERIAETIRAAERAESDEDWLGLGTANIRFHQEVAALAESPRTNALMRRVLAELRLVFHVMDDPRRFHEPYLSRNKDIFELVKARDHVRAASALEAYLDDAEHQLVEAYPTRRATTH